MLTFAKFVGISLGVLLSMMLVVLVYRGIQARSMPDLQKWHDASLARELAVEDYNGFTNFNDYLMAEQELIAACLKSVEPDEASSYSKYSAGSLSAPGENNHSFELIPDNIVGGVLLVHGLTDSPHHLRAVADLFGAENYYVICLRLPGHGTIPGALLSVKWEDWYNAVEFGVRMVLNRLQDGQPLYLGGFSTGGALTLRYTLNSLGSSSHRTPEKLFLFSPAIGVTKFAELADWNNVISWIPFFSKFKWESIKPEYDPCKYNSFPKNAGDQIHELTKANKQLVESLNDDGELVSMPPVYAFQSIVDATVNTSDLVDLFIDLGSNEGELVLFDINRSPDIINFITAEKRNLRHTNFDLAHLKSRVTFATNVVDEESNVIAYRWQPQSEDYELNSAYEARIIGQWPQFVYALSHVSVPISPEDSIYGENSTLSRLKPKGEHDVLFLPFGDLARLRYNPFFHYIEGVILEAISDQNLTTK